MTTKSKYPEHEKLAKVKDKSQAIGEFLDYGLPQGYVLAKYDKYDRLYPIHDSIESLLADHFGIDRDELEHEKQQMLDTLRTANANS